MVIQIQNSDRTFDTALIDRPLDNFPSAFQIWEPPYSGTREYAIVCVPKYPQTDNVVLGYYGDITQCAEVFSDIKIAMYCDEKIFYMPKEKSLDEQMNAYILTEHQMEEKENGNGYKNMTDDKPIIVAKAGELEPFGDKPRVMLRMVNDTVSIELNRDYIAKYYKSQYREYVVLGACEPLRTQRKEKFVETVENIQRNFNL